MIYPHLYSLSTGKKVEFELFDCLSSGLICFIMHSNTFEATCSHFIVAVNDLFGIVYQLFQMCCCFTSTFPN